MQTKKAKTERRGGGKAVNLYLQDVDMERVTKLANYVASHGHPLGVSTSRIIKAALRAVSPDADFLTAYSKGRSDDQRTRQAKK